MTATHGIVQAGAGGEPIKIRLRGEDSEGQVGLIELAMRPGGSGPPLHVHSSHGEGFYVLAGELTFQLGDEIVSGGPGTWAFAPRGIPHTLANLGEEEARLLVMCAPAGFEGYFERQLVEQAGRELPAELQVRRWETRMVGPPLSGRP